MNGPTKMYRMKPIVVHDFAVELPKCMYRMNNIHSSRNKADGTEDHVSLPNQKLDIFDQNSQGIPGMAELEAKQNDILKQLEQLKKQIHSLKCDLNIQNDTSSKVIPKVAQCTASKRTKNNIPSTIVINANPDSPPYSLEILQRLLQNQIALVVTSYLHSTIASLPDQANVLKSSLENFKLPAVVPVVNVSLIWKNISSNVEFLIAHTPISGEVNFLRYLSRSTDTQLSYDSDVKSNEIDSLLDQCYLLVRAKTKTERSEILQTLQKSLSKSQWLAGRSQPSVLDVAAYSAVRQCHLAKDLNVGLGKWYERSQALVTS
ncbi:probable aminoacyl tRNA synthase complex-interacting multifunctional protein 2 isoform X2 [Sitophilus oryzae]|uniref:Probable aminoacyl tRNA synthase complex-interacting multifunctional protein 2 isoform X2 n=1 Tax=Sitophilus oryzae TaxID=7048 RepID=A0A6J2XRF2_SITOR|nr:probable aminoacyl tRNA synthase complex-interacting multifunctional protein 2 isoform X2 [Sitophilus oryzae]